METLIAEVGGKYRVGSLLAETGNQSDYETIYRGSEARIRLFRCATTSEARGLTAGFAAAFQLPHPGLMSMYDFGVDETVAWVVMEHGDECLAEILKQRLLDVEEGRQLAAGLRPALSFLAERGMIHSEIRPGNIFACGDQVKLSADRICSGTQEAAQAQLARLVAEATGAKESSFAAAAPVVEQEVYKPPVVEKVALPKYRRYAGLAVGGALAAAALCVLLVRGAHQTTSAPVSVPIVAPVTAPVAGAPVSDRYPAIPAGWAVLAATYNQASDAERRADQIGGAKVYRAGTRFVVSVAAGLSETQAKKMVRGRRNGVPRGSVVERFR